MKSMNSADEAPESMNVSPGDEALGGVATSAADAKRRRLVRGAVAFAPLVLTLRSGALAAASCTGARVVSVGLNGTGSDPQTPSRIAAGDVCVKNLNACPGTTTKVLTPPPGTPLNYQFADINKKCPAFANNTVAILSSQSAGSMGIH